MIAGAPMPASVPERSLPRGLVAVFDRDLRFVAAEGDELMAALGVVRVQLIGHAVSEITSLDNRAALDRLCRRALEGQATELEAERAGLVLLIRVAPLYDGRGGICGGLVLTLDVTTERRQALLTRAIAENMPNSAVAVFDEHLTVTYAAGAKVGEVSHRTAGELQGSSIAALAGDDRAQAFRRVFAGETVIAEVNRFGRVFEMRAMPIRDGRGVVVLGLTMIYDVSARRAEAEQLRHAKAMLEATLANIGDGVALLDRERRVVLANGACARLFGLEGVATTGLDRDAFLALVRDRFEDPAALAAPLGDLPADGFWSDEHVLRGPARRVLRRTIRPVDAGGAAGFVVVWRDVTEERDLLARRDRDALIDPLTGIANRRAGEEALEAALARAVRDGTALTVAMFDIDHFKRVNDTHGHGAGDVVLQAVAKVLVAQARRGDTVARWGGEEFVAILPGTASGAETFCERVRVAVRDLVSCGSIRVTISAGIAQRDDEVDAGALVTRADQQLYRAKQAGRDRVAR